MSSRKSSPKYRISFSEQFLLSPFLRKEAMYIVIQCEDTDGKTELIRSNISD